MSWSRVLLSGVGLLALAGCAAPRYTVDDGRKVDEVLLTQIRAYGEGERLLRPAITRSARLHDKECDKQWELPFSLATSEGWSADDRVAWVRALQVDERVTVVAAAPGSPLVPGDRIVQVGRHRGDRAESMLERLSELRDSGESFAVVLADGRQARVHPFQVCRGYARLAPPNTPALQDYHWLMSLHPLEITRAGITDDEALWVVLWGQGLSEEGGARMKTYHYVTSIGSTLFTLASLAPTVQAAALAAQGALAAARAAAASAVTDAVRRQLIDQGRALALQKLREGLADVAQQLTRQQVLSALQSAAGNRASLKGVAWIAATVFDRADRWSFERMAQLGGSQLAGFSLHQKLIERGLTSNAFAFDAERLESLYKLARSLGLESDAQAILQGLKPEDMMAALASMPLASAPDAFSFDSLGDPGSQPYAYGFIDALTEMPIESRGRR